MRAIPKLLTQAGKFATIYVLEEVGAIYGKSQLSYRYCNSYATQGAREIETQQRSSGHGRTKKTFLLVVEVITIIALLAAGVFLWQMQRTFREELEWAQQAEASIKAEASATAVSSSTTRPIDGSLPVKAALQRVRIPALGIDLALQPETLVSAPTGGKEAMAELMQIALPADRYGDGVCELDRLRSGDSVFLETKDGAYSYTVQGSGQGEDGEALAGGPLVVITGYPCGELGQQVLVTATVTSH